MIAGGVLQRWYFAPAPAKRLATLRIGLGLYALVNLIARFGGLTAVANFPASQFAPTGPVDWLAEPLPYAAVLAVTVGAILAGFAFVLGWRFRVTGPLFAALFLWVMAYRNSWGMVFHTENLMVLHIAVLGLSPGAADVWAVDAGDGAAPNDDASFGWPIRLLCIVTVLSYTIAAYTKLHASGLSWITSDTLRGLVAHDNLRKIELGDLHSPIGTALVRVRWLFPPLAAGAMAIELLAPLALLGPRIGKCWCAAAWSFHAGVLAVMAILFHYPLSGFGFASFFAVERVGEWVAVRWPRSRGGD